MDWEALRERDPELYRIAHNRQTEKAFSGKYITSTDVGIYHCAVCGASLFSSKSKIASKNGWPAFSSPVVERAVTVHEEHEYGTTMTEVECATCHAYIGRLFCRETQDGGKICDRYSINSVSLKFESKDIDFTI